MMGDCSTPPRRQVSRIWLFAALLAVIPLGLLIGFDAGEAERASSTNQQLWRAILINGLFSSLPSLAVTWAATVFVRMIPNRKLWQPAVLLVLPVMATHYARAYHPLLIALAECSWLLAALTCAKRKRTLALWCVVTCGACVTGIQLTSALAKYRLPPNSPAGSSETSALPAPD